jgi:hypothetical protein
MKGHHQTKPMTSSAIGMQQVTVTYPARIGFSSGLPEPEESFAALYNGNCLKDPKTGEVIMRVESAPAVIPFNGIKRCSANNGTLAAVIGGRRLIIIPA